MWWIWIVVVAVLILLVFFLIKILFPRKGKMFDEIMEEGTKDSAPFR